MFSSGMDLGALAGVGAQPEQLGVPPRVPRGLEPGRGDAQAGDLRDPGRLHRRRARARAGVRLPRPCGGRDRRDAGDADRAHPRRRRLLAAAAGRRARAGEGAHHHRQADRRRGGRADRPGRPGRARRRARGRERAARRRAARLRAGRGRAGQAGDGRLGAPGALRRRSSSRWRRRSAARRPRTSPRAPGAFAEKRPPEFTAAGSRPVDGAGASSSVVPSGRPSTSCAARGGVDQRAARSIPVSTPISCSIETRSSVATLPVAPGGTGQPPSSPKLDSNESHAGLERGEHVGEPLPARVVEVRGQLDAVAERRARLREELAHLARVGHPGRVAEADLLAPRRRAAARAIANTRSGGTWPS